MPSFISRRHSAMAVYDIYIVEKWTVSKAERYGEWEISPGVHFYADPESSKGTKLLKRLENYGEL
jgi:hypothetical protein